MKKLSVGQRKFLAEFSGNFAIAWLVGAIVTPFFTGALLTPEIRLNIMIGSGSALILLVLGFAFTKKIKS